MILDIFDNKKSELERQFESIQWIKESGADAEALAKEYEKLMLKWADQPKAIVKARTFEMILQKFGGGD